MTRRTFREHCFKILFCAEFYPDPEAGEQIRDYFLSGREEETDSEGKTEVVHEVALSPEEEEEVRVRVDAVLSRMDEIDGELREVMEGWKIGRVGKAELAILRLAVYEMKYDEKVPEKVAINEAVELAKKFCGEESPAFVNGILAKLIRK